MDIKLNQPKNKWPWADTVNPNIYSIRNSWPKISIVTPSYNQASFLEETILSIINQNYPNLEFIIIDGNSSDESVKIIQQYQSYLKYWCSEADNGQVDAILKGFEHCTGELFNWINSDDLLAEKSLYNIAIAYLAAKDVKVIAGGCTHFTTSLNENEPTFVKDLTFGGMISEQSYFQQPSQWIVIRKVITLGIEKHLHYSFDWGMILNFNLNIQDIKYLNTNLSYFREHEDAKTAKASLLFQLEKFEIVKAYKKTNISFRKKIILSKYICKLGKYLKVMTQIKKQDNNFLSLFSLGIKSPSLFFYRFYLGYLKALFIEKED